MEDLGSVAWWQWCRLCAKQDLQNNIDISSDVAMTTAIGKYFWVNIKSTDLTQHICQNCYSLITQLISFTERINKVQAMFCMLQNANISEAIDPYELRTQYDLLDEDFEHMIKAKFVNQEIYLQNPVPEQTAKNEEESQCTNTEIPVTEDTIPDQHEIIATYESEETSSAEEDADDYVSDQIVYDPDGTPEPFSEEEESSQIIVNNVMPMPLPMQTESENNSNTTSAPKISKIDYSQQSQSDNPKYVCSVCGKNYKNATSYRKHLETHNIVADLPDFICDKCNKVFPTVRQLIIHNRVHLPLEKKLIVPCPHCDKKFTLESIMKQHVSSVHFNEKPFMCEECGISLKTLGSFNDHKLTHSNDYPYECEVCKKKFKHKTRLKTHMDIHTTTTYDCSQCGVRLNTKRTLKMHMLVHSEERAYKCNFCDANFKRGKALKNHLLLHIGLRPYKCNFCEKTFTNGSNCRSHKKRFHPAELAAEEAAGLKTEPTNVPKISDLRTKYDVKCSNLMNRNNASLSPSVRALIMGAEQRMRENSAQGGCNLRKEDVQLEDYEIRDEITEMNLILEQSEEDNRNSCGNGEDCGDGIVYAFIDDTKI